MFPLAAPDFTYGLTTDSQEEMPPAKISQQYLPWLMQWREHIKWNPDTTHLPPAACKITTLKPDEWYRMLAKYPEQNLVKFVVDGITEGFRIGFNYQSTSQKRIWKVLTHILK